MSGYRKNIAWWTVLGLLAAGGAWAGSASSGPQPRTAASSVRSVGRGGRSAARPASRSEAQSPRPRQVAGSLTGGRNDLSTRNAVKARDARGYARESYGGRTYYRGGSGYYSPYYYGNDLYYRPVSTPVGASVAEPPQGAFELNLGGHSVYRKNGVFFEEKGKGFEVVGWPVELGGQDPAWVAAYTNEPHPASVLRDMGRYLQSLDGFQFTVVETLRGIADTVQVVGQASGRTVYYGKPADLLAEADGSESDVQLWYDGRRLLRHDRTARTFSSLAYTGTVSSMLDYISEYMGASIPLSDLLHSNVYERMIAQTTNGFYRGVNAVGSRQCHHLTFEGEGLDWDIWVQRGDQALPRKLLIKYKDHSAAPRYEALFNVWRTTRPASDQFHIDIPTGTKVKKIREADPDEVTAATEMGLDEGSKLE